MEEIGKVTLHTLNLLGFKITFNPEMLYMTWMVMIILLALSYFSTRNLKIIPNKLQSMFELIFSFLEEIIESTLGKEDGKRFVPLICTIFVFVLLSNWIGIIPNILGFVGVIIAFLHKIVGGDVVVTAKGITNLMVTPAPGSWYEIFFKLPVIQEPTKFLSTDLALAITVFFVVHAFGIKSKILQRSGI